MDPDNETTLRKIAIEVAAILPDNPDHALKVLSLTDGLIRTFMQGSRTNVCSNIPGSVCNLLRGFDDPED